MFSNKLDKKISNTNVDKKSNNNNNNNNNNANDDFIKNKLDKKINNNNTNDDFIENLRDLFSILDYEPILIKTGFDNNNDNNYNYLEYMSNGNNSLSFNEYL